MGSGRGVSGNMAGSDTSEPVRPGTPWRQLAGVPDFLLPLPSTPSSQRSAMAFRRVPAGEFVMGSRGYSEREEPRHRVVIPHDFFLGKYVVTQSEWRAVVEGLLPEGLDSSPSHYQGHGHPVESVSWNDATAWITAWREWLETGEDFLHQRLAALRLPSEAEWEYACRAGSDSDYWNGDGEACLARVGWYGVNSSGMTRDVHDEVLGGIPELHPVGLHGMHGNVVEWCADAFDIRAYRRRIDGWNATNPWEQWDEASACYRLRVVRSGSWGTSADGCRSTVRLCANPGGSTNTRGFRVCLLLGPPAKQRQVGGGAALGKQGAEAEQAMPGQAFGTRPPPSGAGEANRDARRSRRSPPAAEPRVRGKNGVASKRPGGQAAASGIGSTKSGTSKRSVRKPAGIPRKPTVNVAGRKDLKVTAATKKTANKKTKTKAEKKPPQPRVKRKPGKKRRRT